MLNEKEFYQYVEANILNYLPEMEGKKVMVQRVKRNNQISMMGLSIGETKNYLVPVLYLEIFYRNYLRGQELSDTMKDIARIYRGHQVGFYLDEDKVSDYEHIKKNLFYRVVNYEKNKEMLKYTPYERFLDLAVTYRWAAYRNHDGMASALVRNKELLLWGCDKGTDDEGCKGEHGEDLPTSDAQDSVCDTSKDHGYGDSIVCIIKWRLYEWSIRHAL